MIKGRPLHWLLIFLPIALLGLLMTACGEAPEGMTPLGSSVNVQKTADPLFEAYYQQLGGASQVGQIISGLGTENDKQCQYTTDGVMCYDPSANGEQQFSYSAVEQPTISMDTPYDHTLNRMGGREVFGEPQGEPVIASDGQMEQVYTNIVVYSPPDNPNDLHFRPLARSLGMPAGQPGPKKYDRRQNVIFYPVDGDLGFHVPVVFDEFIAQHGGVEKSGRPISEPIVTDLDGQQVARQCFDNYCLDYYINPPTGDQIQLAPLGLRYTQSAVTRTYSNAPAAPVVKSLSMLVSEDKSQVTDSNSQTFYLLVYQDHTKEPQSGITATIDLMLPDGANFTYQTPPTGLNGWTSLTIPPLPNLKHGAMVAYEVCLDQPVETKNCVSDMYLVWNYQ